MELQVRVQPKARRNSIEVVDGSKLKIYVTTAPEGGKANDAVVALLAKSLGVAKSHVRIVRGHKSRDKLLDIEGLTEDEVIARLTDR
ncbi:MAG: DUF167 domain-containing protein [Chloroflexi bacterium]|nr:DUF167 domain-containing protein [Chloroflexota bacterium]